MRKISWKDTMQDCRRDLAAVGISANGSGSTIFNALRIPGTRLLFMHRLQRFVGADSRFDAFVSSLIWNLGYLLSGCNVGRLASISGGVVFPHPVAIVIGNGVHIEPGCWIYQSVTLGATQRDGILEYPRVAADCRFFPGACVLGPVQVAAGTIVAANSVLLKSTEPGAMYAGNPAVKIRGGTP